MFYPLVGIPLVTMGWPEWLLIGLAIAIFFGASKLPKLGQGLGEGIRNFKKGLKGDGDEPRLEGKDDSGGEDKEKGEG